MEKRGTTNAVPDLSRDANQDRQLKLTLRDEPRTARITYNDENAPNVLVVEKLQAVAFDIQQTTDHCDKQDDQ